MKNIEKMKFRKMRFINLDNVFFEDDIVQEILDRLSNLPEVITSVVVAAHFEQGIKPILSRLDRSAEMPTV